MSSMPRKWKFRLRHMREAIDKIQRYTQGMDQTRFQASEQTVEAVVWNLTVMGSAPWPCSNGASAPYRTKRP
jgi:uncharacterized protein with HEPN domain